jgi:hypothetical protein
MDGKTFKPVNVEGEVNIPLGGRSHVGGVKLAIDGNTEDFCMILDLQNSDETIEKYAEWAVFGFLDVALTQGLAKVVPLKITVTNLMIDDVNSSLIAFRLAGRKAGWQYLKIKSPV